MKSIIENIQLRNLTIGLFLLIVGIFFITTTFDFVGDDKIFITDNTNVNKGFQGIKNAWTNSSFIGWERTSSSYRPIALTVLTTEVSVFGENTFVIHFFHIVFYSLMVCAAFIMIYKISNKKILSLISVLLFAGLPINSEVVSNVKNIDTLLMTLFGFISVILYLNNKKVFVLFLLLSVLSKETGVIFMPFIIFLEFSKTKKIISPTILYSIVPLVIFLILRFSIISNTFDNGFNTDANELLSMNSPVDYYLNAFYLQGMYILKMFVPGGHIYYYSTSHFGFSNMTLVLGFLVVLVMLIVGGLIIKSKNKFYKTLSVLYLLPIFFLGSFIFANGTVYADRFFLIPTLAISSMTVFALNKYYEKYTFIKYSLIVIPLYFSLSIKESLDWKNENTLVDDLITNSNGSEKFYLQALSEDSYKNRILIINKYEGIPNTKLDLLKAEALFALNLNQDLLILSNQIESRDIADLTLSPYDIIYLYKLYAKNFLDVTSVQMSDIENCLNYYTVSDSYYCAGVYYVKNNDFEKAKEYYLKGIELNTFVHTTLKQALHLSLGVIYMIENEPDKGYDEIVIANQFGANFEVLFSLAKYHYFKGEKDVALDYVKESLLVGETVDITNNIEYNSALNMLEELTVVN